MLWLYGISFSSRFINFCYLVADIDIVCGRYGACCGRYGLWPISLFPGHRGLRPMPIVACFACLCLRLCFHMGRPCVQHWSFCQHSDNTSNTCYTCPPSSRFLDQLSTSAVLPAKDAPLNTSAFNVIRKYNYKVFLRSTKTCDKLDRKYMSRNIATKI